MHGPSHFTLKKKKKALCILGLQSKLLCLLPNDLAQMADAMHLNFSQRSNYVAQAGLESSILLPQLPEHWKDRSILQRLAIVASWKEKKIEKNTLYYCVWDHLHLTAWK